MKIWLLTHSLELNKKTATGPLVKSILKKDCEVVEWSRVFPNHSITSLPIEKSILVYPSQEEISENNHHIDNLEHVIILDGTWQQARKMYNQSPYLKRFHHYQINNKISSYKKRRNQKNNGLCTAEVAIHMLEISRHPLEKTLSQAFNDFNQQP